MNDIFIRIVLGHLVGDYLLQTKHMALRKSDKGWTGVKQCLIHCFIYTATICLFAWWVDPLFIVLVFVSHYPIDRWSLGGAWLKMIRGRTFVAAYTSTDKYREFDVAFTSIVYTVTDNTMHIVLLWLIVRLLIVC
ncbi:MAG: DUF3307 domain-containing protein [Patescibacteria group bacterium]|jgi:hypothetical protein